MKVYHLARLQTLVAFSFLLAGCAGPVGNASGPRVWIDAPMHESTHPLAPMEIVLHGADPGGVAMIELSVNGEVLSRKPPEDAASPLTLMKVAWDPLAPGEYVLVARAQNHAGAWSPQTGSIVTLIERGEMEQPPAITPAASRTPPPVVLPTSTPTPACVDRASFIADVTIPDNSRLSPGAPFTKIWRLRNDGTCTWNEEYSLVFVDGAAMNNNTPVSVPNTVMPGGTVDLAVEMVAPTVPGTYRGDYQIRNPHGVHFGVGASAQTPFYVQIVVGAASGPSPTAPPAPDTQAPSVSVSHSPPGGSLPTGSMITFTATASDNVGVVRIDLWVTAPGGWPTKVRTCTDTTTCSHTGGPYNTQGNLSYFAVAADAAGHETTSSAGTIVLYVVVA